MTFRSRLKQWFSLQLPENANLKARIILWCCAAAVCLAFGALVLHAGNTVSREYVDAPCQPTGTTSYTLSSGSSLQQDFTALGQSVGEWCHFYLNAYTDAAAEGTLTVRLYAAGEDAPVMETSLEVSKFPETQDPSAIRSPKKTRFPMSETIFVNSGSDYRLVITNESDTNVHLLGNPAVTSGTLAVDGTEQNGFVNFIITRCSLYRAGALVKVTVLVAIATVLFGLALVLFTNIKTHVLYLVLAAGFGLVTLFDVTSLYGFDMRFQYDSVYVVSNELMGLNGVISAPSPADPNRMTPSYYRRVCDDYSQFQRYQGNEVSANYVDTYAGLRNPFVSEEKAELELVPTDQGFVSDQLYLYLPQAVGLSIGRLLGLGMFPSLMLARMIAYSIFVLVVFFSIRAIPFGKRILLILALTPAVLVQTVSISRDAMIITMSYFLIARGITMAYDGKKPGIWAWLPVLAVSVLLAPCKYIYLPVSCFFLLVVYRQYIRTAGERWKVVVARLAIVAAAAIAVYVATNFWTIKYILSANSVSIDYQQGHSIPWIFANPMDALYLFLNTFRNQIGTYLVNTIQLFDIDLGSSNGITLIVFLLLLLESFRTPSPAYTLRAEERGFMILVALGVFCLVTLASFRWTPIASTVIEGLQGRYLVPAMPLVFLACHNSRVLQIRGNIPLFVKVCCCLFPAVSLMNMYLWTITR